MKIDELNAQIAAKEKRLNKIVKQYSEKPALEKEITELKAARDKIESEKNSFFGKIEAAGMTIPEAEKKLGLGAEPKKET